MPPLTVASFATTITSREETRPTPVINPAAGTSFTALFTLHHTSVHSSLFTPPLVTQLSREPPPPLPGGFAVGDTVFFCGEDFAFEDGDGYGFGAKGEVAGPDPNEADCLEVRHIWKVRHL